MLISHRKKFIYTKTIKTAGTSVESFFEKYCMPDGLWAFSHARELYISNTGVIGYRGMNPEGRAWYNHMSAKAIRDQLDESIWNSYFKFCVVRNPFEKVVSAFHFFEIEGKNRQSALLSDRAKLIENFRIWLGNGNASIVVDRDKYTIDGHICLDYVIRYERLEEGLRQVCDNLDIPVDLSDLPRLKVSSSKDRNIAIADYYDQRCIDIVESLFEFEIVHFGYRLSL